MKKDRNIRLEIGLALFLFLGLLLFLGRVGFVSSPAPLILAKQAFAPSPAPLQMEVAITSGIKSKVIKPGSTVPPSVGMVNPIQALLQNGKKLQEGIIRTGSKGESRQVEIYQTDFKYPMIRVEKNAQGEVMTVMVADHILVHRRSGIPEQALLELVQGTGLKVSKHLQGDTGYLVTGLTGLDALEQMQGRLNAGAGAVIVDVAEPDYLVTSLAVPNDPLYGELWGLHHVAGSDGTAGANIDAPEGWDINHQANSLVVAVIDTGIDYTHPDLAANIWINPHPGSANDVHGYDFYNNDGDPMDDHYHGTHVAGIIAAGGNNGVGVTGVAWSAQLMALKFLSSTGVGATSDAIQCVHYATVNGAKITSNSWGGGGYSSALQAEIAAAGQAGVLFVAAAGNNGQNADTLPMYPAAYNLDNIISVAASDENDQLASFSNYGSTSVDIAAPGVGILSTIPGNQYGFLSGTSMATPFVSGACALLLAEQPNLTPLQVKLQIMGSADSQPNFLGKIASQGRLNLYHSLQGLSAQIPVITSATQATLYLAQTFQFTGTASNNASRFAAIGLPAGLSLNKDTGLISGTATTGGIYPVTVSASNVIGTGTATLTLTVVAPPPVITSSITAGGVQREFFFYPITATNTPSLFSATGLPAGLTINTATGLIAGYPTQTGQFTVQLSAQNTGGTGTATLSLQIDEPIAPVITSPAQATGVLGTAFSYQIIASSHPTVYRATGLPAGLSLNGTTGLISGIPAQAGTFGVTLEAENEGGVASVSLTLIINPPAAPVISSSLTASVRVNQQFSYQIAASNNPTSFTASNLPNGLSISTSGLISGTPTQSGEMDVLLAATNVGGTGLATLQLTVLPELPSITSPLTQQLVTGQSVSYQITASASPSSFGATGLPSGWAIDPATGLISGTAGDPGMVTVVVSATNVGGTGSATVTFAITPLPPVIISPLELQVEVGQPVTYQINASHTPLAYGANNLPSSLALDSGTGLLTGQMGTKGQYTIGLSATNAGGTGYATLILDVVDGPTRIVSFSPQTVTPEDNLTIQGTGFTGATAVYFSDRNQQLIPAENFTVQSDTQIQARVPYLKQATDADDSWIIVISPKGLAVAFPPSTIEVFTGYDLGGAGSRSVVVHQGGALIGAGGGSEQVVVESGGSARLSGGGGNILFVDSGGLADLSGSSASATVFSTSKSVIINEASVSSTSAPPPGFYEVAAVRATIMNQLLKVRQIPVVTSASQSSTTVGADYFYQITVSGFGSLNGGLSYGLTSALPPGLTFDAATGLLQGRPTSPGHSDLPFSVTNSVGTTLFTLGLDVTGNAIPVINSPVKITGTPGSALSYQITAANSPTSFGASNLPANLSVNSTTGLISGIPSATGIFTSTLTATNSLGTGSRTVTFFLGTSPLAVTSVSPNPVAAGSILSLAGHGLADAQHVYFISRSGQLVSDLGLTLLSDTSLQVLVPSLSMSPSDRTPVIVTTADRATATFPSNVTLMTSSGTFGGASSAVIVGPGANVALGGGGSNIIYVESGGSVTTGGGSQIILLETGAIANLSGGGGSLVIRSPNATVLGQGSSTVVDVPALGLSSIAATTFLNVYDLPVFSSGPASGQVGQSFTYTATLTKFFPSVTYGAVGLPPGLTISSTSGIISGTPTVAGSYDVQLQATNSRGTGTKTVTFTITPGLLPMMTSATRLDLSVGSAVNFQITAANSPTLFQATGLPPGLSLSTGGHLTGTPTQGGAWLVNLQIGNPYGNTTLKFILAVDRPAPLVTSVPIATTVDAVLNLGGTGLQTVSQVYFKDHDLGLGKLGTGVTATGSQVAVTVPALNLQQTPGAILTLIGEGGATVAIPATMPQVTSGNSVNGGGSVYYRVRSGGILGGSGGSWTVYAEGGSVVIPSGGGGHMIWAENGATVDLRSAGGSNTVVYAPNANVLSNGNATLIAVTDMRASDVPNYLNLQPLPIITSAGSAQAYINVPFYFVVTAQNTPTGFSAMGLPTNLTLNSTTGAISGAPTQSGVFVVTLTATNTVGSYTKTFNLSVGDPFDYWKDTSFESLAGGSSNLLAQPTADADGDHISNLMEYATGSNPLVKNGQEDMPASMINGNHLELNFRRLRGTGTGTAEDGYTVGGILYTVQWSSNLVQWQTGSADLEQVGSPTDNGDGTETIRVRLKKTISEQSQAFLRLNVERIP